MLNFRSGIGNAQALTRVAMSAASCEIDPIRRSVETLLVPSGVAVILPFAYNEIDGRGTHL
jgi:hypothetical protein